MATGNPPVSTTTALPAGRASWDKIALSHYSSSSGTGTTSIR
nr:Hypothetical protein [Raoultella ornithinolytica]